MGFDKTLATMSREFLTKGLDEKDFSKDPVVQFEIWLNDAVQFHVSEPNAMTLATANKSGKPRVRTVLLKGIKNECFVFFTNYNSKKGKQIKENPYVSLNFYWKEQARQIIIEGKIIQKLSAKENQEYFSTRPIESQIGAIISKQSSHLKSRKILEDLFHKFEKKEILMAPKGWGGYLVKPSVIEFWQGRPNRLHDRISYTLKNKKWLMERLYP